MQSLHGAMPLVGLFDRAATQHIGNKSITGDDDMKLFARLFAHGPTRREAEMNYLADSVSRYDLERREREVALGRFAHL